MLQLLLTRRRRGILSTHEESRCRSQRMYRIIKIPAERPVSAAGPSCHTLYPHAILASCDTVGVGSTGQEPVQAVSKVQDTMETWRLGT